MSLSPPDFLSQVWGWENVRRDVFQLVAWGYQIAVKEIRTRNLEEDITGLIRKGINEKLDEELPPRFQCYSAHNEDPVDEHASLGKDRPRVDIMIECSIGSGRRRRYRLEGKRCARGQQPIRWYAMGIKAFVECRYAKDSPEAGLLGLVQSDTEAYWKSRLAARLEADASLASRAPLTQQALIGELHYFFSSEHLRQDGSTIVLYHVFLDCK
jgi:hypothetical protein